MLTRKHAHARDILRRHRKEAVYRPMTPRNILADLMASRSIFFGHRSPVPVTMNRETWRMMLGLCRNSAVIQAGASCVAAA